jgi:hypothetical protein
MTSAWKKYKEKLGDTRPWDILDKNNHTTEDIAQERFSICLQCPELIKATKQCKQCGCFMNMKVKLSHAVCPLGKW